MRPARIEEVHTRATTLPTAPCAPLLGVRFAPPAAAGPGLRPFPAHRASAKSCAHCLAQAAFASGCPVLRQGLNLRSPTAALRCAVTSLRLSPLASLKLRRRSAAAERTTCRPANPNAKNAFGHAGGFQKPAHCERPRRARVALRRYRSPHSLGAT